MRVAAFDPGKYASYAIYDNTLPTQIEIGQVTTVGTKRYERPCGSHIAHILENVDCAIVEEVGAMPTQGVSSMFTFGMALGSILGAITGSHVQLELVRPQIWKAAARISTKDKAEAKDLARSKAIELFPQHRKILSIKKNHGLAEAIHMARWYFSHGLGQDAI